MTSKPAMRLAPPPDREAADAGRLDFDAVYDRFAPYVAAVALRLCGREDEVDDLVQEVFVLCARNLDRLPTLDAARAWLATVTVRTTRRHLRRRRLRRFFGLQEAGVELEHASRELSPEGRAMVKELYRALDQLPVTTRLVWTLRHIEGKKLREIAEASALSLATVKRQLLRAQVRLAGDAGDEDDAD